MAQVDINAGFSPKIFQALRMKVSSVSTKAKLCSVIFDEMTIKENVSYNKTNDNVEGLEDFGGENVRSLEIFVPLSLNLSHYHL